MRFLDSFKFMSSSFSKPIKNLKEENFKNNYPEDKLSLLMRKCVYPYGYVDSPKKLKETQLPPKEAFYSKLDDEHISDDDYAHAQKVWKEFGMKL